MVSVLHAVEEFLAKNGEYPDQWKKWAARPTMKPVLLRTLSRFDMENFSTASIPSSVGSSFKALHMRGSRSSFLIRLCTSQSPISETSDFKERLTLFLPVTWAFQPWIIHNKFHPFSLSHVDVGPSCRQWVSPCKTSDEMSSDIYSLGACAINAWRMSSWERTSGSGLMNNERQ